MKLIHVVSPLLFIWSGLLFGVSFVATPAKFLASSLQLAQALDVGRWTFHVLELIEWGLVVVLGLLVLACRPRVATGWWPVTIALMAIAAVLAVETWALRPMLEARTLEIMAGRSVPPNSLHTAYVALEVLKLVLVLAAAVASARWKPATARASV